jgi:hypothetical protein
MTTTHYKVKRFFTTSLCARYSEKSLKITKNSEEILNITENSENSEQILNIAENSEQIHRPLQ